MNYAPCPIGIMPRWLHDEHRLREVSGAIQRYTEAGKTIPAKWIEEYNDLCKSVEEHERSVRERVMP